ncbi:hypothetical protein [Xanthomonas citri]|uniref:hypothetical protein n=1 Tax=Xanthomonas citri TaxID=346 RepID=UPI001CBDDE50|nr:hypothetical protein [Xanthomonas citri]
MRCFDSQHFRSRLAGAALSMSGALERPARNASATSACSNASARSTQGDVSPLRLNFQVQHPALT